MKAILCFIITGVLVSPVLDARYSSKFYSLSSVRDSIFNSKKYSAKKSPTKYFSIYKPTTSPVKGRDLNYRKITWTAPIVPTTRPSFSNFPDRETYRYSQPKSKPKKKSKKDYYLGNRKYDSKKVFSGKFGNKIGDGISKTGQGIHGAGKTGVEGSRKWFEKNKKEKEAEEKKKEKEKKKANSAPSSDREIEDFCRPQYESARSKYSNMGDPNAAWRAYQDLTHLCKDWFGKAPKKHKSKKDERKDCEKEFKKIKDKYMHPGMDYKTSRGVIWWKLSKKCQEILGY